MGKRIVSIIACICNLALIMNLTGCYTRKESDVVSAFEKTAVCYVIANTANSKGLNLNSPLVKDTAYSTIRNYGYVSVINVDGSPEVVLANSYDIDEKYKTASSERLDMDARSKECSLITTMQTVTANDPETDYIEALQLAVRSLSSLNGYNSKKIIVLGTGLSSVGILNFRNNLLLAEPDDIVEILKERESIPCFSGIDVYFQHLGDVEEPQQKLTDVQKNRLQQIYSKLVEAGGGTFKYNEFIANPVNENIEYPEVTPVELPSDTPIYFDTCLFENTATTNLFKEPVVLPEKQITFVEDKWEYLHPDEARSALEPIAEYLINNKVKVLLCGTTAGDEDSDYTRVLSKNRSEAVKKTLVGMNVNDDQIITVGLGSNNPWHIYGVGYDGPVASQNRSVVIIDVTTDTARDILNQYNK